MSTSNGLLNTVSLSVVNEHLSSTYYVQPLLHTKAICVTKYQPLSSNML